MPAFYNRGGASNGPVEAINGRLEHLRGIGLGFGHFTHYVARSLLEAPAENAATMGLAAPRYSAAAGTRRSKSIPTAASGMRWRSDSRTCGRDVLDSGSFSRAGVRHAHVRPGPQDRTPGAAPGAPAFLPSTCCDDRLIPTSRWSYARGSTVVPSRWQATPTGSDTKGAKDVTKNYQRPIDRPAARVCVDRPDPAEPPHGVLYRPVEENGHDRAAAR